MLLYLGDGRSGSFGSVRIIESVGFESIEFLKVGEGEVTIDLVFVDDALRQRLLRHLSLVYLLLHRSLQQQQQQNKKHAQHNDRPKQTRLVLKKPAPESGRRRLA